VTETCSTTHNTSREKGEPFMDMLQVKRLSKIYGGKVTYRALTDIDVLTITSTDVYAYINYMQIKEGAVVFSKSVEIKKKPEDSDADLLAYAAQELRSGNNEVIYTNIPVEFLDGVQ